jgi:adenine-specific DNA-methyltransferase
MPTLQFKGKNIIWNHHMSIPFHTLDEMPKLDFQGEKGEGNLIIEGDNLLALKALLPQYAGKVQVVCVDPPYNTGNEGWVYNDKVNSPLIKDWLGKEVGKDDLTRHDKWLCMMSPRLRLLRELLAEQGVIFISCDDNEFSSLLSLMNELWGEENRVGIIVWRNVTDNNPTNIAIEHEYIVCYAKQKNQIDAIWKSKVSAAKEQLIKIGKELTNKIKKQDDLQAAYSDWFRENKRFLGQLDRYKYIDHGGIYTGSQSVHNPGKEGYRYDVLHPSTKKPCRQPLMGYRFPEQTMKDLLGKGKILFGEDESKIIELKIYAEEYEDKLPSVIELDGRLGAYDLRELFPENKKTFDNPKPIQLLKTILSYVLNGGDLVLDSFAGSGTTMHAVMDLNKEDNGNRKCILVQMTEATEADPKKNICKDITRERVKRAIEKYGYNSGFKYLKVGIPIDPESMLSGNLPTYKQFAKYVYYLCTGENVQEEKQIDEKTYFVGTFKKEAVYLLYKQDYDTLTRLALNLPLAEQITKEQKGKKCIVYAPACFLEEDYLKEKNIEYVGIPYNLFKKNGR